MRGIKSIKSGTHILQFVGSTPLFRGIHAKWKLLFHYNFINYGKIGHHPNLILELPQEGECPEGALFLGLGPGHFPKDLAEGFSQKINEKNYGRLFEVVIKDSRLVWMKEIQIKGDK